MALFGLTQKVGAFISWNRLGIQLDRLRSALADWKEKNPMTWKQNALNTLKHLGLSALSVVAAAAASAFLNWLGGPACMDILNHDLPSYVTALLVPVLHSLQVMGINRMKAAQ